MARQETMCGECGYLMVSDFLPQQCEECGEVFTHLATNHGNDRPHYGYAIGCGAGIFAAAGAVVAFWSVVITGIWRWIT